MLLDQHIAPGCVLLFVDLINYPDYRDHEIKALWEWLDSTGRKVEVSNAIAPPEPRKPASSPVGAQVSASLLSHLLMWHVHVSHVGVHQASCGLSQSWSNSAGYSKAGFCGCEMHLMQLWAHVHPERCWEMHICHAA